MSARGFTVHPVGSAGSVRFELRDRSGALVGRFFRLSAAEEAAVSRVARAGAVDVIARAKTTGSAA